jgi:hypothetical protein
MNAFQILVIILSITLAVFLVLAITAIIMFIGLLRGMRDVPEKVNDIVESLQEVSGAVRDTATPLIMIGDLMKKFFPGKKGR